LEDDRRGMEDYRRRYGYDEKEAEAAYHLGRARSLIGELYQDDAVAEAAIEGAFGGVAYPVIYAQMVLMSAVNPHFDALEGLLVRRSLARQYPEGWGRRQGAEDEG
jgi:hypothetical protein